MSFVEGRALTLEEQQILRKARRRAGNLAGFGDAWAVVSAQKQAKRDAALLRAEARVLAGHLMRARLAGKPRNACWRPMARMLIRLAREIERSAADGR